VAKADESPHLEEEPQSARGAPGSRDKGGPPGSGPVDRPSGPEPDASTGIDEQETVTGTTMPTGDQGG
jgi:hypothetical protein